MAVTDTLERTKTYQQFIGGQLVDAASGQTLNVENPANGQTIATVPASGAEDVDRAVNAAGAARVVEGKAANEYLAGHTSLIRRDPVGVVASIAPWNYPLYMAGWKIGPALAAGNTVVLKPSARTPLTALVLAEIAAEILPPGVLNVITGTGDEIEMGSLIAQAQADKVEGMVDRARDGSQIVTGGTRPRRAGAFYEPTVI